MKDAFTHQLKHPIKLPDQQLSELKFPRMKGKYMRKFEMKIGQEQIEQARSGKEVGSSMTLSYGQYMELGEYMLKDEYGPVTAHLIFDEMDPEDVHEVVAVLGERFAGGQTTGATA